MNPQLATNPPAQGTITIQHIFPSKGPGKSAWIKDTEGMMFGFWPNKLGDIRQGETYEIEFTETVKNGTTYRDLTAARIAARPGPAPAQFTASHQPRSLSSAASEPPRPYQPQNYRQATPPRESEQMMVCSLLNAFIQAGRVDCHRDHLIAAIAELRAAYAATFGKDDH
jgi:hypothetical protein